MTIMEATGNAFMKETSKELGRTKEEIGDGMGRNLWKKLGRQWDGIYERNCEWNIKELRKNLWNVNKLRK